MTTTTPPAIHDTVTTDTTPLTAQDRCDRCGAQAYLRAVLPGGGDLLFCRHHAREHGDKLRQVAVTVTDETARLEAPPVAPLDER